MPSAIDTRTAGGLLARADSLEKLAKEINKNQGDFGRIAKRALKEAEKDATSAAANFTAAIYQSGKSVVEVGKGAGDVAEAMVYGARGTVLAAAAGVVGAGELVGDLATDAAYYVFKETATMFDRLSDFASEVATGRPNNLSFTTGGKGTDGARIASDIFKSALESYATGGRELENSLVHLGRAGANAIGAATNVALGAIKLGETVGNLAFAAGAAAIAGAEEAAEWGLRASAVAVRLAAQGLVESSEALAAAAKIAAALANASADGDQNKINAVVGGLKEQIMRLEAQARAS